MWVSRVFASGFGDVETQRGLCRPWRGAGSGAGSAAELPREWLPGWSSC